MLERNGGTAIVIFSTAIFQGMFLVHFTVTTTAAAIVFEMLTRHHLAI
jgi:hypothetical protein